MERLRSMTGLDNVKKVADELSALAREELVNERLGILHKNMIFVGNPGTGKTTSAKLLADIMAEEGNTNTSFVIAERKSLIGKYVGHTAHNVAGKFEEARGGVLFVDEAGFFLNEESGGYVEEAMKEFVRYMELYPDVTVIFAMYSDEVEQFLNLDSGLSSRISRFVKFEDYTIDELTDITVKILTGKGYVVDKAVGTVIYDSLTKIRNDKKKQFGNAREARNLAESVIIAASMRRYREKSKKNIILAVDVEEGYSRLCTEADNKKSVFGFQTDIYVNKKMRTY